MNIILSSTAMAAKPPAHRTSATTEVPKPPASESSWPVVSWSFAVALVLGILFLTVRSVFHGIRKRVEAIESWRQQTHESLQALTKQNAANSQNIGNLGEQLRSHARKLKETSGVIEGLKVFTGYRLKEIADQAAQEFTEEER